MAIFGFVEANILVNGEKLVEHQTDTTEAGDHPSNEGNTVTTFVEAVEGANFEVALTIDRYYQLPGNCDAVVWDLRIGKRIPGKVMSATDLQLHGGYTVTKTGVIHEVNQQFYISKFKFGGLHITQDDSSAFSPALTEDLNQLGTVRVEAWTANGYPDPVRTYDQRYHSVDTISEKALKGRAITLNAGLDKPQPHARKPGCWQVTARRTLLATFFFQYRTKESLYQLGVLERPQSPLPLEERELNELTEAELRQLVQSQRTTLSAQQRKKINLKNERTMKRERSPIDVDEIEEIPQIKRRPPHPDQVIVIDDSD